MSAIQFLRRDIARTRFITTIFLFLNYCRQGYEKYLDLVRTRKVYNVNLKDQEWMKRSKAIGDPSIVRVLNINYVIRPPRICVLRLALLNPHTREPSGEAFTIKYHDMNDVVDFLVLYNTYKGSTARGGADGISGEGRAWKHGDRIRCMIDDCWWKGTVHKVEYHDANKRSPFLSIFCHWDNGEKEQLSPWDVEALDEDTADIPDGTPVTPEQLKAASLFHPTDDEWNGIGRETDSRDGNHQIILKLFLNYA
jgi:bromodomain and WD repeat domain-containing protein 1/3